MAKKHKGTKYPTHHVKAHPPPPHLTGSGNKSDGAYGKPKDHSVRLPARGKGRYLIEDGSREHVHINVHSSKTGHHSKPGHTEQYPFRQGHDGCNHVVPHAFRAHHQPHSGAPKGTKLAHGPMGRNQHKPHGGTLDSYSPLRFSGHPGAHQVGKLSKGKTTFSHEIKLRGKSNLAGHNKAT